MNLSLAKAVDRYLGITICYVLVAFRELREYVAPRTKLVEARSILLIKFWGLGNVVLLLPVIRLVRERFPDARITFVSLARNRPLLDACPHLDRRIYVNDRNVFTLIGTLVAAVFRAGGEHPDLAVDFEQFARSSTILATLARSKQVVGLATPGQGRAVLYHKRVRYDDRQHMSQTYLDLARAAGVEERLYRPEPLPIGASERAEAARLVAERWPDAGGAPLVLIHPGSGDNFEGRRWPAASFARLADRLVREEGARIVVSGGPSETALAAEVVREMEEGDRALDVAGKLSVLGLAALVEKCTCVVTNDTAPVHIASSLGIPVFAFFGPNTPRLYGPLSRGSYAFFKALPCSPCLTNMNYKTSHCRMPVCIQSIGVDEVWERVKSHLAETRAGSASPADPKRA